MKIFISWAKRRSKRIAQELVEWIPKVNHVVKPWWSDDLEAGERWRNKLSKQLEDTHFGIVCITPEGMHSPWINFEAGALAKSVSQGRLCPYLFGLEPEDVKGPLSEFQLVRADREGTFKLMRTINAALDPALKLDDQALREDFDYRWPRLETVLGQVPDQPEEPERERARQLFAQLDQGAGPLPSEVSRGLWIPHLFQEIRSHLNGGSAAGGAPTVDVFDINALAPLHSGFEMFLELLGNGGRLRIMMLDPRSDEFAARSALERDEVGRIAAEEVASFHIIGDLIDHMQRVRKPSHLEVRLTAKLPGSAIVLVNVDRPNGVVLSNPYPTDADKRGLASPWYTYTAADAGMYSQYRDSFNALWGQASRVAPRTPLRPPTDWPFVEVA